jgi:HTH-like domain
VPGIVSFALAVLRLLPVAGGARMLKDQSLALEGTAIHPKSRGRYDNPRIHSEMRERSQRTGHKRVARLMRTAGLRAREPRASNTPPNPDTEWQLRVVCWCGDLPCWRPVPAGSR